MLDYNKDTGIFTWKERGIEYFKNEQALKSFNSRFLGKFAGSLCKHHGYIMIRIHRVTFISHRLAWLYVYGCWPSDIDHINGIKTDNRICNLREANKSENMQNIRSAMKNNKSSGLLGVTFSNSLNKFMSRITINGKTKFLGYFNDKYDAHKMYLQAKRQLHPFGEI